MLTQDTFSEAVAAVMNEGGRTLGFSAHARDYTKAIEEGSTTFPAWREDGLQMSAYTATETCAFCKGKRPLIAMVPVENRTMLCGSCHREFFPADFPRTAIATIGRYCSGHMFIDDFRSKGLTAPAK